MSHARVVLATCAASAACGRLSFAPLGDSTAGDGGGPPCGGTVAEVVDDFDDGVLNPMWGGWYEDAPNTLVEADGFLQIRLAPSARNAWAGYATDRTYDLRSGRVYVEVREIPQRTSQAFFAVVNDRNRQNGVHVESYFGEIFSVVVVGGNDAPSPVVSFDPVAHRWWQIRERAGMIYFETAPDARTWTAFYETPAPPQVDLAAMYIVLDGGNNQPDPSPGNAIYDNVNTGGVPGCP